MYLEQFGETLLGLDGVAAKFPKISGEKMVKFDERMNKFIHENKKKNVESNLREKNQTEPNQLDISTNIILLQKGFDDLTKGKMLTSETKEMIERICSALNVFLAKHGY